MVIDSSALIALLLVEPDWSVYADAIAADHVRLLSAANALEAAIVAETRRGPAGGREFDLLMHRAGIDVVPADADQMSLARVAWRRYGRGRHPAGLNFGDCFAYALAMSTGETLLFKGDDFARTDVTPAV